MALQSGVFSPEPFAAVASFGGAVLEPKDLPACCHPDMPIFLFHNRDDDSFEWNERFIPMLDGLQDTKHNVTCVLRVQGGHHIAYEDMVIFSKYLAPIFGYPSDFIEKTFGRQHMKRMLQNVYIKQPHSTECKRGA